MKKPFRFLPFLALSFLLAAFSIPPRSASAQKPILTIEATSQIGTDGSGTFVIDLTVDKNAADLFQALPNSSDNSICESFTLESDSAGSKWTEEKTGDGTRCHHSQPFQDLDGLKTLTEKDFSPAHFNRLEIADGHLYYDLAWNTNVGSGFAANNSFALQAYFILKMPGDVVKTNATKTSGRTLTWDLTTLDKSSHIQAESQLGGSVLGMDPTLAVFGVIILLGCCCVLLLVAGGVGFFLIRRKPATVASEPAAASAPVG
jgi:hypothetical protein